MVQTRCAAATESNNLTEHSLHLRARVSPTRHGGASHNQKREERFQCSIVAEWLVSGLLITTKCNVQRENGAAVVRGASLISVAAHAEIGKTK